VTRVAAAPAGARLALLLLVATAAAASAHWETPAAVAAGVRAGEDAAGWGVTAAAPDAHVPRLLVVRVGDAWFAHPAGARARRATAWLARWRHSVPHGVIAVLDAASGTPVVRFGAGGTVAGVVERANVHGRGNTTP
jgi:hypothetical protein